MQPKIRMNDSEQTVYKYLTNQCLGPVVFEPDGKSTMPDFLVDGRIAVEVRRLNQNEATTAGYRGLEEVSKPLNALVRKVLSAMGPPVDGASWFVFYTFKRPLPQWKSLEKLLSVALREARDEPHFTGRPARVGSKMSLRFARAGKAHRDLFVLGASADHDAGGFVVGEMARNLRLCIAEKTKKMSQARGRYSEWWLVFEDRIGHGTLEEQDRNQVRRLVEVCDPWSRIILVNPQDPTSAFDL